MKTIRIKHPATMAVLNDTKHFFFCLFNSIIYFFLKFHVETKCLIDMFLESNGIFLWQLRSTKASFLVFFDTPNWYNVNI